MSRPSKYCLRGLLAVVIVAGLGCGRSRPIYDQVLNGNRIIVFEKHNPKSLISVHSDKTKVLCIGEVCFENIRGVGPGFQKVEELQMLVFVTDEGPTAFIHGYDLLKKLDLKVPLGEAAAFGYFLGHSNARSDSVTFLTTNTLLLSYQGFAFNEQKNVRWQNVFDLEKKTIGLSSMKDIRELHAPTIKRSMP